MTLASAAQAGDASLPALFKSMSGDRGPNGRNIIQCTGNRYIIGSSNCIGDRLFQGAFRSNDVGRSMAKAYDF